MKSSFGRALASIDAFGASIDLNFKGKTKFTTKRGGILTILIYSLTLWQVWIQATQLYT